MDELFKMHGSFPNKDAWLDLPKIKVHGTSFNAGHLILALVSPINNVRIVRIIHSIKYQSNCELLLHLFFVNSNLSDPIRGVHPDLSNGSSSRLWRLPYTKVLALTHLGVAVFIPSVLRWSKVGVAVPSLLSESEFGDPSKANSVSYRENYQTL